MWFRFSEEVYWDMVPATQAVGADERPAPLEHLHPLVNLNTGAVIALATYYVMESHGCIRVYFRAPGAAEFVDATRTFTGLVDTEQEWTAEDASQWVIDRRDEADERLTAMLGVKSRHDS